MDHMLQYLSTAREEALKHVLGALLLAVWYGNYGDSAGLHPGKLR
jgi:hypothetical protein